MRKAVDQLTFGERVAYYRRRRGLSQRVLAGLVGRTEDWLSKVENNRIEVDRLSVLRLLADRLNVAVGELVAEPALARQDRPPGRTELSGLRNAVTDARYVAPFLASSNRPSVSVAALRARTAELFDAYQESRYRCLANRTPDLLTAVSAAADTASAVERPATHAVAALAHQVAAAVLTKIGEPDAALMVAQRGLTAAYNSASPVVLASLLRSVVHALLSVGPDSSAVTLARLAVERVEPELSRPTASFLSVYGSLLLTGAMAAARAGDRGVVADFLAQADQVARRQGRDANHLWTSFGPTNVAVHRVATALELGDLHYVLRHGPAVHTAGLPVERRARHALSVVKALSCLDRAPEALALLLEVEHQAPEQIRHHVMGRQLVADWVRRGRGRRDDRLDALATRMGLL